MRRSGTRVYLRGDPSALIIAGNAIVVMEYISNAGTSGWATMPSLEPEVRGSRTVYVKADAVSAVVPMLAGEVRKHLEALDEDEDGDYE